MPESLIPSLVYVSLVTKNSHFGSFANRFSSSKIFSTFLTSIVCWLLFLEKTRMSSMYTMTHMSIRSWKMWFMYLWNMAGAFFSPKGMTMYSKRPSLVLKAVFHLSPSLILILLKPMHRSILEKIFASLILSRRSSIKGIGNLSSFVMAFTPLRSWTSRNCHTASGFLGSIGFLTKKQGDAMGDLLGRIFPVAISSSRYSLSAIDSAGESGIGL